jgi:Arc/MetJ-type ribon-helix-helix transcriptional regulator
VDLSKVAACIAIRYAFRMTQFVTRVDPHLAAEVDALVTSGVVHSRSEAVRLGLAVLVDQHRRRAVGNQIARGYVSKPQTEEELAGLDDATRALIAEEPW